MSKEIKMNLCILITLFCGGFLRNTDGFSGSHRTIRINSETSLRSHHRLRNSTPIANNRLTAANRHLSQSTRISQSLTHFPMNKNNPHILTCKNDDAIDDIIQQRRDMLDDFKPKNASILESLVFFSRYIIKTMKLNRQKKKKLRSQRKNVQNNALALEGEDPNPSFWKQLINLNKGRKQIVNLVGYTSALLTPAFSFLILGSLFTSIVPHYYSNSITALAASATATAATPVQTANLFKNLIGLGIFSTLMAFTTGARGSLFWMAGARANYNVRTKFHRNLLRQEAAFFDGTETGILISRLNNDVNKIGNVVSFHVNVVLRQMFQFIFGSVYLLKISPALSFFAFSGIAIIGYISKVYGDFSRDLASEVQDLLADGSAVAETSFALSETVRAFNGLDSETKRYESAQFKALELEEVQAWAYGTHKFVTDTLQSIMQVALLIACWTLVQRGTFAAARLTTFLFYVNFVLESSNEVGDQWAKIQTAIGASSSVIELVRRIPKIMDPLPQTNEREVNGTNGVKNERNLDEDSPIINMDDMTVTYDEMDTIDPALQSIDLKVYPNDRIAIVGRSGSGKSSMLRTVLRFYDPSSGSCILDGKVLTQYTRKEIANKVVIVEQEPHLFPMTLYENVLYGYEKDINNPSIQPELRDRVSEALELAGLPVGERENNDLGLTLDTRVGEGGRTLSGGQRQRVAIARALVRKPDVLLLDEPTAALDSKSEITVVKALKQAMDRTRCMLMVTHRFSPIRSLGVNKVILLDRGKIAEIGHPEDLLRQNGLFAQMAREQGIFAADTEDTDEVNGSRTHLNNQGKVIQN